MAAWSKPLAYVWPLRWSIDGVYLAEDDLDS
jgi:hypothetical protein